jgi:hypothetical protein
MKEAQTGRMIREKIASQLSHGNAINLCTTGATTPSYGAWPIVAADWANPNYPYSWLETRGLWSCSATGGRDCDHKD